MDPENDPSFDPQTGPEKDAISEGPTPSSPEVLVAEEKSLESRPPVVMWADIFFALLSEPEKTLAVLADSSFYAPDRSALFGTGLLVALASMISYLADAALEGTPPTLFELVGGLCGSFIFWFFLALFLKLLAVWVRHDSSLKTCAIVTGWAFLPLIFKAPFMCFTIALPFLGLLMVIPSYWFLILEMYAFDSVLKLGRLRMFVLAIAIPPLVVLTYLFWLTVTASMAIAALASMFPNAFS
jgi:hypothetical protein